MIDFRVDHDRHPWTLTGQLRFFVRYVFDKNIRGNSWDHSSCIHIHNRAPDHATSAPGRHLSESTPGHRPEAVHNEFTCRSECALSRDGAPELRFQSALQCIWQVRPTALGRSQGGARYGRGVLQLEGSANSLFSASVMNRLPLWHSRGPLTWGGYHDRPVARSISEHDRMRRTGHTFLQQVPQ